MPEEPESYWTAVANIVRERPYGPGGAETRLGTKHFAPGAKVYIIDWFPGTCERIVVVGMHRKSKKFIAIVLAVKLVENLREKVCYQPAALAKIKQYCARQYTTSIHHLTHEFAETICRVLPIWQAQSWRILLPEPAEKPSPTLQLLREADRRLAPAAAVISPAAPVPQAAPFITKLWRSILFLLKD